MVVLYLTETRKCNYCADSLPMTSATFFPSSHTTSVKNLEL